jgi:hypothetical protein
VIVLCRDKNIVLQDEFLRRVVYAINKAVVEDAPSSLKENHRETNNVALHLKGDCINDNLRRDVVGNHIELLPIKRFNWAGRAIIDRKNYLTYTITTVDTLKSIPKKKGRTRPHFLQSILYAENRACAARHKQMDLGFAITQFDNEELEEDYDNITHGFIEKNEDYRHYVIAYKSEENEIVEIMLKLLDKDFDIVDEASLMDYIKPDFAKLTEITFDETVETSVETVPETEDDSRRLVAVKSGYKPKLRDIDKPSDD